MFYDNFAIKCNEKGISPTAAAIEMGFHKSEVTRWKKGTTPRRANLLKMAKYFECQVDDLTLETKKTAPFEGDGLSPARREMLKELDGMTEEEIFHLLDVIRAVKGK